MDAHTIGHRPDFAAPESASYLGAAGAASVAAGAEPHLRLNPQKESTLGADTTQSREQNALPDFADDGAAGKARATIAARFAMRGYALHQLADETYLVTRWNLSRPCIDLHAARRFLAQVEGTK
jgi:hypothetical protein